MNRVFVSLAGHPNTGKTSAVEYLEKYGFGPISPPRILEEMAPRYGITLRGRRDWTRVRGCLTNEFGPDWLPEYMLAQEGTRLALDGLSTLHDYHALRRHGNIVLALVCSPEEEFRRQLRRRHPAKDTVDYQAYLADREREAHSDDPTGMGRQDVVDLADYHVDASRPIEVVHSEIGSIIETLLAESPRV